MNLNEQTWNFVRQHQDDNVRKLALQGSRDPAVDLTQALQQIAGRQTARKKLPSWAKTEGLLYPPHLNMEQCSSEQTAHYKAKIVGSGDSFVDLTGGFGVDFYWMSQGFQERTYVEQDEALCTLVEANMGTLGYSCLVCRGNASAYVTTMSHASVVFLDPARRNEHGGRTHGIEDCTPNVLELLPLLMQKSERVLLKLSPMLDWRKAVEDIEHVKSLEIPHVKTPETTYTSVQAEMPPAYVHEVHIVSVDNECKELLLLLGSEQPEAMRLFCVNDNTIVELFPRWEQSVSLRQTDSPLYLYEPNASIMKSGCFAELAERYGVRQVDQNSHLFLSADEIGDFPGRGFRIEDISSLNKKIINQKLTMMKSANISVRNFPLSAEQLRKKLKLKDGGDIYIFATTVEDGSHRLFICRKIG